MSWPKVELREICVFAYGKSLPSHSRSGSEFAVFGSNGPVGRHGSALTDSETIIIGRKGSFGEVHYTPSPCFPIDTTYYITKHQTDAFLPWLSRCLRHLDLKSLNRAAAVPGLNREDAYRLAVLLPPLPEQKRIAGILDAADALRAKRRESLALLDNLLQSTFLHMFGDPVTNPMGWEILLGHQVAKRITVGIVVKPASYYKDQGIPALRSLNIKPNRVELKEVVYISRNDNETKLSKTRVWRDDVLLVRTGRPGTAAVVPEELSGVNAIDLLIFSPATDKLDSRYLSYFFNSDATQNLAQAGQRGQIQKHLNVSVLNKLPIILPPLDLQRRFASIVESVEQQKARMRAHLAELDALFASLQHRAFNGEL